MNATLFPMRKLVYYVPGLRAVPVLAEVRIELLLLLQFFALR